MKSKYKTLHQDKESVRDYWQDSARTMLKDDRFSDVSAEMIFDHTWITTARAFLGDGQIRPESLILDVGCGWGRSITAVKYFQSDVEIVGVDTNQIRLEQAKMILSELEIDEKVFLEVGDADKLSFKENTFDTVISARLLQYVPNPSQTLAEFIRVLKPGGRLAVTVPNRHNPIRYFTYSRVIYSRSDVRRWFEEAGLVDISCRTIGFLPTFRRFHWQSKMLSFELAQRIPIANIMGGLVLCSGSKRVLK